MDERNDTPIFLKIILIPFFIILFIASIMFAGLLLATSGGTRVVGDYSFTILIKEEPKEVFLYLTDFNKRMLWEKGLTDKTMLTQGGEFLIGARALETGLIDGKNTEYESEVLKYSFFLGFSVQNTGASTINTKAYTLKDENGTTRLITSGDIVYNDSFGVLMSPLKTGLYKNQLEDDLKTLKLIVEQN